MINKKIICKLIYKYIPINHLPRHSIYVGLFLVLKNSKKAVAILQQPFIFELNKYFLSRNNLLDCLFQF